MNKINKIYKKTSQIFFIFSAFVYFKLLTPLAVAAAQEDIFGTIAPPPGVDKYNPPGGGIGIVPFMSNLIRVATIVAGIWSMINFILAGFYYVTSGDNKSNIEKANDKMTRTVIGLLIIVASYTIAALIGLIIFGDATFILNPQLKGIDT